MADEKKSDSRSKDRNKDRKDRNNDRYSLGQGFDDIMFYLLILLLLGGFVMSFLRGDIWNNLFSRLNPSRTTALSQVQNPVGGKVMLSQETEVFSEDGEVLGIQPKGARGTVAGGPIFMDGERYWYVDFESGPDGWVPEDTLLNGNGGRFNPGSTPIGSGTLTGNDSVVYAEPGGSPVGSQPKGAKGIVTKGPYFANGDRYWYVDFESGPDGWVKEKDLLSANGGPFNPGNTVVGSEVAAVRDLGVLDEPGGRRIGSHQAGDRGIIVDGPRWVNGKRYWYIDFENGADGWVDEADLVIVRPETLISKVFGIISNVFKSISAILSLLFLSGIIYSLIRISQVVAERDKKEKLKESPAYSVTVTQEHVNRRWEKVITHVQSEGPGDWRLAILEADIMLSEMLDRMGYIGENVGEKLKRIEKSDFDTIEDAWEAHKVRNMVAHRGSDYVLSKREAQRIISLYANVFREFRYI